MAKIQTIFHHKEELSSTHSAISCGIASDIHRTSIYTRLIEGTFNTWGS